MTIPVPINPRAKSPLFAKKPNRVGIHPPPMRNAAGMVNETMIFRVSFAPILDRAEKAGGKKQTAIRG